VLPQSLARSTPDKDIFPHALDGRSNKHLISLFTMDRAKKKFDQRQQKIPLDRRADRLQSAKATGFSAPFGWRAFLKGKAGTFSQKGGSVLYFFYFPSQGGERLLVPRGPPPRAICHWNYVGPGTYL